MHCVAFCFVFLACFGQADKYIKAVLAASASKKRDPQGVSEDLLSPLTKLVIGITSGGWLICCVVWAILPDDAATGRVMVMLTYLCIVASTTVCNVHMSTAAVMRGLDFAESQIDIPDLLTGIRALRSKLAITRRLAIVPGTLLAAVTGSLLIMTMTPLEAELTQRVDYLALTWLPIYIAALYNLAPRVQRVPRVAGAAQGDMGHLSSHALA
jgi:hypothetical protein